MTQHPDAYWTLKAPCSAEYKEKGSKFYAFAKSVSSEEEFNQFIDTIKSDHPKARHFCYAYKLQSEDIFRINDDGEPSGTAGKPIFNQILSFNLVDVACVVVRYFGGTKLGASGLIRAYKEASKTALESGTVIEKFLCSQVSITFSYALMGTLLDILKSMDINITEKTFGESPILKIAVKRSEMHDTINQIKAAFLNRSPEDITPDTKIDGLSFLLEKSFEQ